MTSHLHAYLWIGCKLAATENRLHVWYKVTIILVLLGKDSLQKGSGRRDSSGSQIKRQQFWSQGKPPVTVLFHLSQFLLWDLSIYTPVIKMGKSDEIFFSWKTCHQATLDSTLGNHQLILCRAEDLHTCIHFLHLEVVHFSRENQVKSQFSLKICLQVTLDLTLGNHQPILCRAKDLRTWVNFFHLEILPSLTLTLISFIWK